MSADSWNAIPRNRSVVLMIRNDTNSVAVPLPQPGICYDMRRTMRALAARGAIRIQESLTQ